MIDAATLRELIDYDPETGSLTWRHRVDAPGWSTRWAGKPCGAKSARGYVNVGLMGKTMQAHTIAWIIATGGPPSGEIDHINGVRWDNRLCNLRDVSRVQNQRNLPIQKNNRSGHPGVERFRGKWRAVIVVDRHPIRLGTFPSFDQAKAARVAAEKAHGFTVRA